MTIDVNELRCVLTDAMPPPWAWDDAEGRIVLGHRASEREGVIACGEPVGTVNPRVVIDPPDLALLLAAVNALPALLAVYAAAEKLRGVRPPQYDGALPTDVREFLAEVDAARKAAP